MEHAKPKEVPGTARAASFLLGQEATKVWLVLVKKIRGYDRTVWGGRGGPRTWILNHPAADQQGQEAALGGRGEGQGQVALGLLGSRNQSPPHMVTLPAPRPLSSICTGNPLRPSHKPGERPRRPLILTYLRFRYHSNTYGTAR